MAFIPTPLNLPEHAFRITLKEDQHYIFDEIRKKHLVLTPEEWVRQHFIQYLIRVKKFPKALIQVEGGLSLNKLQKRTDIVIFNAKGERIMVIECKAPKIKITQATFDQAARYNSVHKTRWLVVTNGLRHCYAQIDHTNEKFLFVEELPLYSAL
ncbi:type I restriction enzyme HsdR N-terminal domain-containing protein [Pedobacter sp. MC2016-14]|uniref:type I restriction enzyme HsdR N-terminal domain-containing protein n=1 Tax=Pedobacter sp. MC2016-14 TaxID=2897327 RepID=UPI001E571AAD|nr:type I restriction enzyme HsdR N-terminal domain-containing protein [Pedobacter sp. MC2016-14]MCD0489109.1 type I restriction enzyme HsdR N-terminal domain-containing protein [Pedobacter sp. MC2016-14]